MEEDTAAYFHGLFWRLLLLSERAVRGAMLPAVLGRLGLLLTVVTLELWPEEPWLSRPVEKKPQRSEVVCVMEHKDTQMICCPSLALQLSL